MGVYDKWTKNEAGHWCRELDGVTWEVTWSGPAPDAPKGGQRAGVSVWIRRMDAAWTTSTERSLLDTVRMIDRGEDPTRRDE